MQIDTQQAISRMQVYFTIDTEEDCPPYLNTFAGMEKGLDVLLSVLEQEDVRATFFVTGEIAKRFGQKIARIVAAGHELGSHGNTHCRFDALSPDMVTEEISKSTQILSSFSRIRSFRAPYLRFPYAYLGILKAHGYAIDSSTARYKYARKKNKPADLIRIPVSVTSSFLRLPEFLTFPILDRLSQPVVLFVHPWEFVDWTKTPLRYDCRFNTGEMAISRIRSVLQFFEKKGAVFDRLDSLLVK